MNIIIKKWIIIIVIMYGSGREQEETEDIGCYGFLHQLSEREK